MRIHLWRRWYRPWLTPDLFRLRRVTSTESLTGNRVSTALCVEPKSQNWTPIPVGDAGGHDGTGRDSDDGVGSGGSSAH